MKKYVIFAGLLLCFGLGSCQCSEKPEIGPVEDEEARVARPAAGPFA